MDDATRSSDLTKLLGQMDAVLEQSGLEDVKVYFLEDKSALVVEYEAENDDAEEELSRLPEIAGKSIGVVSSHNWPEEIGQVVGFIKTTEPESSPDATNTIRWTSKADWHRDADKGELSDEEVLRKTMQTATLIQNDGEEREIDLDLEIT